MPTIYIVAQGAYSDYGIVAAFSEQAAAEEYANKLIHGDVVELDLDSPSELWFEVEVTMSRDGEVVLCTEPEGQTTPREYARHGLAGFMLGNHQYATMHCRYATTDKTQAIKSASETRARVLALGLWPESTQDYR